MIYGLFPQYYHTLRIRKSEKQCAGTQAAATWGHIAHSSGYSIEKALKLIGQEPRYSSIDAVKEAVSWWIERNEQSNN